MLNSIQQTLNKIDQIEKRIEGGAPVDSASFQRILETVSEPKVPAALGPQAQFGMSDIQGINPQLWSMLNRNSNFDASAFGAARSGEMGLQPLAQNNGVSCGQTSVAMAVNTLTGKHLTDNDINSKYGFELLNGLNAESAEAGYEWKDGGNLNASSWELIDHKVNNEKTPVIVALTGPEFSPSGRGHIVTIVKTEGNQVTFADPATGTLRTTTKEAMNTAPSHPDGNFVFYAVNNNDLPNTDMMMASR